jgi:outer membrane receptor protein involved in Fe transport
MITNIYRKSLLTAFFMAIIFIVNAQGTIQGTLKDSATGQAIPGANITLAKSTEPGRILYKLISADNGSYKISLKEAGKYVMIARHVNYKPAKREVDGSNNAAVDIILSSIVTTLTGVKVESKKSPIETQDDKIIYNLDNDPASKTENAVDILRKTPMVSVDGNDNIQLNGQSNFKILLNGRETSLFAANPAAALKSFTGATISRIEIITNPSAKYDAEGVGGLINIITKKKLAGYNGVISARYNTNRTMPFNANLSLKTGKLGISLLYGGFASFNQRSDIILRQEPRTATFYQYRDNKGFGTNKNFHNFGNMEIAYDVDSLTTAVVYGNISGGVGNNHREHTLFTAFSSGATETATGIVDTHNEFPSTSIGADLVRRGKRNKQNEFSLRFLGDFNTSNTEQESSQFFPTYERYISNQSLAYSRQYTFQADYVKAMKDNSKLEVGVKKIVRYAESDFSVKYKFDAGDSYTTDPGGVDVFQYDQQVDGVYGSYQFKVGKVQLRAGARWEHTVIDGDFVTSKQTVKQDYNSIIPNVQATFKVIPIWNIIASYTKRLERPFIQSLNPFVNKTDTLNLQFGNPGLAPQNLHIFSMQHRVTLFKTLFNLGLFYQYSDDKITGFTSFDPATGVSSNTMMNIGKEKMVSANLNFNAKLHKKLSAFFNLGARYIDIRTNNGTGQGNSGWAGNINLNATYTATKRINITMMGGGFIPPVSLQGKFPANYFYGVNTVVKVYKDKLTFNLIAMNFHKDNFEFKSVVTTPGVINRTNMINPWRNFGLGFTWNFGKLKEVVSKKKGINNDDGVSN